MTNIESFTKFFRENFGFLGQSPKVFSAYNKAKIVFIIVKVI